MMEIFKNIEGYNDYQVSNLGNVKSLKFSKEKILKNKKHKSGYLHIKLYKNRKCKFYLVHRLVAKAFLPNPNDLPEVNHIDENKTNNAVWNLEWCDREHNNNYGTRTERVANACSKPVLQIDKNTHEVIRVWKSMMEAEREGGFDNGNISSCCNGKCKSHKGYIWKFA